MGDNPRGDACAHGKEKSFSCAYSQWGFDQPFASSRSPAYPDRAVPDARNTRRPPLSTPSLLHLLGDRLPRPLQSRLCNIGRRFGGLALESHARQSGWAARPLSSWASEALHLRANGKRPVPHPHTQTKRILASSRAQGGIGLSQRKRRNRAKSPSVEQSVSPCSTESAAR